MTFEKCAVTISDWRWDFSNSEIRNKVYTKTHPKFDDLVFFLKLCDQILESEIPQYTDTTRLGANALRCNASTHTCWEMSSIYDFEWTPKLEHNLSWGLIWESNGEPNYMGGDEWEDWEVEFEFLCDPTNESIEPEWIFDITKHDPRIVLKWHNKMSCGQKALYPATPTPGPWNPDTDLMFRDPQDRQRAIKIDMKDVSNGRYGVFAPIDFGSEKRWLFFHPSDRIMACPGTECDADYSSAWVCKDNGDVEDPEVTSCVSYGTIDQDTKYDLLNDHDIYDGFYYSFDTKSTTNQKFFQLNVKCDNVYPAGHLLVQKTEFQGDMSHLTVWAEAKDACPRTVPTPSPATGCHVKYTDGGYTLDLDLSKYGRTHENPYNISVRRRGEIISNLSYWLLYTPCDHMLCPDGYDCGGDEDAYVWLCEQGQPMPGKQFFCSGYGLAENNMSFELSQSYIFAGVDVTMTGDNKLSSIAHWKCDNTLGETEVKFEDYVLVRGNSIMFDVAAKAACATGSGPTPTPPARVFPRKPVLGTTPTPWPMPSPNPIGLVHNATHYIIVNLEQLQERQPLDIDQEITIRGKNTTTHTVWSSWKQVDCPQGWNCGSFQKANLWQCWFDENWDHYCHPVADKYVPGFNVTEKGKAGNLESGISIVYEGQLGVNMEIVAICDPNTTNRGLPIGNSRVFYHDTRENAEWVFTTETNLACPKAFDPPPVPTAPRQDPPSGAKQTTWLRDRVNGHLLNLDLNKMQSVVEPLVIGAPTGYGYHRAEIHFSPINLIGCPKNRHCGNYSNDKANVWKCVGDTLETCYPVGDRRYGLSMEISDETNEYAGISANYEGGAGKYQIHFNFQCNETIPYGNIEFDETGVETPGHVMVVFAHTRHVCPGDAKPSSGGGIFLIIVFSLIVGYFGVGTLIVYVIKGVVELPFQAFWTEVWLSLTYIASTCKPPASNTGAVSYDKI